MRAPASSACTTSTPARSCAVGSADPSSSATRPRSSTTTTASSSTTPSNRETHPTPPNSRQPSPASPAGPAGHPQRSPQTAATARPASKQRSTTWAYTPSPSRARANPDRPDAPPSTDDPSAPWSSGAPDVKAVSPTSNADLAGTAPSSMTSPGPEPGAATGYSPTTSPKSAP